MVSINPKQVSRLTVCGKKRLHREAKSLVKQHIDENNKQIKLEQAELEESRYLGKEQTR